MDQGQDKFYQYILARVPEEKQDAAKALLSESFQKQADGSFDQAYLTHFAATITSLLQPEHMQEVVAIMKKFGTNFTK